jgi:hypothetical protein
VPELTAISAGGSGDVEADALDVKVDGSGDVRFHGDPALTRASADPGTSRAS